MGLLDEATPDKFRIIVVPPVFLADCESDVLKKLSMLKNRDTSILPFIRFRI